MASAARPSRPIAVSRAYRPPVLMACSRASSPRSARMEGSTDSPCLSGGSSGIDVPPASGWRDELGIGPVGAADEVPGDLLARFLFLRGGFGQRPAQALVQVTPVQVVGGLDQVSEHFRPRRHPP